MAYSTSQERVTRSEAGHLIFLSHEHYGSELSEPFFEVFELFINEVVQTPTDTPREWVLAVHDIQATFLMT